VVFRRLVVLAVVSWDEDVGSTYNTHGRRRIFVKESVVTHDSAFQSTVCISVSILLFSVHVICLHSVHV
jgi:hypothetical protein